MSTPQELELLLRQSHWVRALALEVLGDPQGADDVTQDTLVAAMRHGVARADESRLRAWLRSTARNFALAARRSAGRRRRRETQVARPERLPSASDALERIELQRRLAEAVRALPSPEREIVALRYFDDCTPREIARQLGLTPNAVSSRLTRARAKLREALDGDAPESRAHWALVAAGWPRSSAGGAAAITTSLIPAGMLAMKKTSIAVVVAVGAILTGAVLWPDVSLFGGVPEPADSSSVARLADIDERTEAVDEPPISNDAAQRAPITSALTETPVVIAEEPASAFGEVVVHVTRADNGEPAPGIGIMLFVHYLENAWDVPSTHVTDDRGQVTFEDVPAGDATIYIRRLSEEDTFGATGVTVVRGETAEVAFEVVAGTTIRGHVVDYAGRAIAGAEIWLGTGSSAPFEGQVVTRADENGDFEIRHTSSYQGVAARAPGLAPSVALVPLHAAEVNGARVMELVLPSLGGTIEGRVVDHAGAPVVNALVVIGNAKLGRSTQVDDGWTYDAPRLLLRSDADGRFRTELMGTGEIKVRARATNTGIAESTVVVPEGGIGSLELVLEPAASIVGRVETESGDAVVGARVQVLTGGLDPLVRSSVRSDADGHFELRAGRAGSVRIEVETDARESLTGVVETVAGETTEWIAVMPRVVRMEGRVESEGGTPLRGWFVQRKADDVPHTVSNSQGGTWTNAAGEFVMESCLDIPHTVTVRAPGQLFSKPLATLTSVAPTDANLVLAVPTASLPTCGFAGRVVDSDGAPIAGEVEVSAFEPLFVSVTRKLEPDGTFDIRHLPPAEFKVTIKAAGFEPVTPVDGESLAEGEQRNLGPIVLRRE